MYVYIVHSAHTQISETEQKKTNKTIIEKHRKKYAQAFFLQLHVKLKIAVFYRLGGGGESA